MSTVFLDTETLGLDRAAPVWEFAAIAFDDSGREMGREHFLIVHDPTGWLDTFYEPFLNDYRERYVESMAVDGIEAAHRIYGITAHGAVIAGSNPAFDMERLTDLLTRYDIEPAWHYHPFDVPTLALGWLAAQGRIIPRPWKSDAISRAAGVDPDAYARHTAMGDVLWSKDLYVAVTGGGVW